MAMKKVRIALTEDGVPMTILREISLLRHLGRYNHPNIVRLVDICHGPRREREMALYLVFEHVHEDLDKYIKRIPEPGVPMEKVKDLMWQILCGVDFLHSHRIVHRDIKPQNILYKPCPTEDGKLDIRLADFGSCIVVRAATCFGGLRPHDASERQVCSNNLFLRSRASLSARQESTYR